MSKQGDLGRNLGDLRPHETYFWASYLPSRYGKKFKRHHTLGHAKLAVNYVNGSNADGAEIYEWSVTDNVWELAYYVDKSCNLVKYTLTEEKD